MEKHYLKILSIALIILGISVIINPRWYSAGLYMQIDLTGKEWPVGSILILSGIALLWYEWRN